MKKEELLKLILSHLNRTDLTNAEFVVKNELERIEKRKKRKKENKE